MRRRGFNATPVIQSAAKDRIDGGPSPHLILRSRAKRGVSKDGQQHDWSPPFETALRASSG